MPARRPSSPSTTTPWSCAYSTTFLSQRDVVGLNEWCEPSIMTEVKPPSMQDLHSSKVSPWSRCTQMGRSKPAVSCAIENRGLDQLHQVHVLGVIAGARGDLQDQRERFSSIAASVMP